MDVRLRIAVTSEGTNVSALCRELGITRETFYVWKRRYDAEGLAGLEPRSRAPKHSPGRISPAIEDRIVELRKELDEQTGDHGPASIQWHLHQRGIRPVPSQATIWRALTRRGFVTPEPRKRPKSSWHRFEADRPNELWQADCTDWTIATGLVKILSFLDDHSRVALRVRALDSATSEETWNTFSQACRAWGVPVGQLTDNGLNFSGKLRSVEVLFERELRAIGVVPKTSRPYHPQTCGKVERFQQTMKKWLRRRTLADTITELQAQLDEFVAFYNHQRPHRANANRTPGERWAATPPAINLGIALPGPTQQLESLVGHNGVVGVGPYRVNLGVAHAGKTTVVHYNDTHIAAYIDHRLVRAIQIDPTRRYQPITSPNLTCQE